MFEEQQEIGNLVGATLFDEIALKRQRFVVSDQPKTTDLELHARALSVRRQTPSLDRSASKCSICSLISAMNWSPVAPSTRRWS